MAVTCAGADVLRGRIHMPLRGAWWAELVLNTATLPKGVVTIDTDGGLSLSGTVIEPSGVFLDTAHVQVVGGAGGLTGVLAPRAFQNALLRDPLSAIVDEVGEKLSSTIDTSITSVELSAWTITASLVTKALDELCFAATQALGATVGWRVLTDGSIWLGQETWPAVSLPNSDDVLDQEPAQGRYIVGAEQPTLTPGVNLSGVGQVVAVDHWLDSERVRTWAWTVVPGAKDALRTLVRGLVGLPDDPGQPPFVDRLARYRAKVVACAVDGSTVDVQPEDKRISPESNVPVRVGIPGATAVVQSGAIVLLGWERGDPSRPFAEPSWESGASVTKLVINAQSIFLGAEGGAEELVKKSEFNAHMHTGGTLANSGGSVTGSSGPPTAPATGTTQVKAV